MKEILDEMRAVKPVRHATGEVVLIRKSDWDRWLAELAKLPQPDAHAGTAWNDFHQAAREARIKEYGHDPLETEAQRDARMLTDHMPLGGVMKGPDVPEARPINDPLSGPRYYCDECGLHIPVRPGGSIANRHHAPTCSLYDPNED